jgi:uncharacterized heparinase superfamily protein
MAGVPAQLQNRVLDLARRAAQGIFALPGYRWSLIGRTPAAMIATPADLWPGDADRGAAMIAGNFVFAGVAREQDGSVWAPAGISAEWLAELHGFTWLRDLRALGGDEARHAARRLVADWIAHHRAWSTPAWRSDVVAARVAAWLAHYDTFFASGEDDFRRQIVASIAGQIRHLDRAMRLETRGAPRISALRGRILASLCLEGGAALERNLRRLDREVDRQVLGDGGHVARSPRDLLTVLRDLLDVRAALAGAQQEVPGTLQAAIDRMGPMLRYLRYDDGGLARFNGAGLEEPELVEAVAELADPQGKPAARAPAMGFERLTSGYLTVLVDSGAPPPPPWDDDAHAGTLGIEVSAGGERLIVNCGAAATDRRRWLAAQRATAAHSTAVVSDRNSSELLESGHVGRRRATTAFERETSGDAILLSMSHDGYVRSDGVEHRRRLFLPTDGEELRGEDSLTGPAGVPFTLRFHLHPSVRATLLHSGRAVLLKTPGGVVWRLQAGAPMQLAESIYFQAIPEPKRTSQVVIEGTTGPGSNTVKWALHHEGRRD